MLSRVFYVLLTLWEVIFCVLRWVHQNDHLDSASNACNGCESRLYISHMIFKFAIRKGNLLRLKKIFQHLMELLGKSLLVASQMRIDGIVKYQAKVIAMHSSCK